MTPSDFDTQGIVFPSSVSFSWCWFTIAKAASSISLAYFSIASLIRRPHFLERMDRVIKILGHSLHEHQPGTLARVGEMEDSLTSGIKASSSSPKCTEA
ncbi:unnamed protein product, partial [Vitis vinifera]|uniref:Uncharacterized protein n=1 Tax=Vitis vinifera TaxID=29760 RepID=D7U1J0_VITVI